ncbi:CCR4-NOT transcription complex subunit 6-like [Dermatophagoides pteronyssinus]|uniref:poly(A)-specific ribonuclease n=1 Tax=Dermatophagoides pteronyssinus TaxID=6956 RepID=A0ABQ8JB89_DERPT|nr:CCR4-NOT transcription complex subunit 6-like [Dermatophagoides pteronyssinus]
MTRTGHRDRENKYEQTTNNRRAPIILTADDIAQGKESYWSELEISGLVRNLSPQLWSFTHLTGLYLNDNNLTKLSPDIAKLEHLILLDLSNNKLRSLPAEIGELIMLRELYLNHNNLRQLPYELGRLFQLQQLALKGNPLTQELLVIYNEQNGVQKLLTYLLDNLQALHAEGVPLIICDDYLPISVANCSSKSLKYQHSNGGGAGISGLQSRNNGLQPGSLRRRSYRVLHPPPQPLLPSPAQFYFHHLAAVAAAAHAAEAEQQQIRNNFTSSYHDISIINNNNINNIINNGNLNNRNQSCSSCLNTTTANVADDDEQSTFRDENEFSFQEDGKMVSILDLYKHQEQTMSRVNFVKGDDLIRYPSSISNGYQQPPNNKDIENHLESSFIESGSSSSSCSLSTDLTASSSYCSSSFFNQESDIVDCLTGNDNMKKIGNGNVDRIVLNDNSQHLTLQSQCSDSASTISSTSSSSSNSHDHNTMMANINIDHQSKRLSVPRMLKPRKRRRKTNAMMAATAESFVAKQSSTITNSSSMLFDLDDYHNQYCSYKTDVDKQNVPDMQPPTRPWLTMAEPTPIHHVSNVFTVMCYNVLCDKLASRQLYSYCPSWALSWDFRKNVIMKEIKQYDADIICLQEVESGQFESFFLPELKISHYYGIFSPKSRAKTMNEQERKRVDGCAIFFKTEKFELVNEHLMEFTFLAAQTADGEGSEEMLNRVMPKDNIGLVALLKTRKVEIDVSEKSSEFENMQPFESQPLVVCTAHIHWDPEYCDVKLIQTMLMMRELQKFIDQSATMFNLSTNTEKQVDPNSIPLIICGDFNSLPDSGVVEYLSRGRISVEHPDFKKLAYKLCLRKVCPVVDQNEKDYTHPFDIVKAYADGVLPFTNYTFDFRGVIDYIFCSQRLFSVLGVLGPLDTKWFSKHRIPGCPHHYIPSDHFPIVAELELLTKKSMAELEKQKQQQEKNNLENKSGNKNNNSGNNSNGHVRR